MLENDRRYAGHYYMPNDEQEQTRLNIIHQAYLFNFQNRLTTVELHDPHRILDIGTGTGEWAIEMGEQYPMAEILGTDLSAIQPSNVPSNIFFEIDDAEDETGWTFGLEDFDLIHLRNMNGAFKDWDAIYQRSWTHLKSGGWIEVVDFDDHRHLSSYFGADSEIMHFLKTLAEAAEKSGFARSLRHLDPEKLRETGFTDVKMTVHEIPLVVAGAGAGDGDTGADEVAKSTARLWLVAVSAGFEATGIRLLTRELGWTPEQVKETCARIVEALKALVRDPVRGRGLCIKVNVLVGRKPSHDESVSAGSGGVTPVHVPRGSLSSS